MATIGIIDYGSGNFGSVWNAHRYLGLPAVAVTRPEDFGSATHILLPGVGAFGRAMERLGGMGILGEMRRQVDAMGKPFLGVCVGMQILATVGLEFGEHQGLDYIPGKVARIEPAGGLPVPHMGWNEVETRAASPLFRNLPERPSFYFVHSYQFLPADPACVAADCEYGGRVVAAVSRGNVHGVQFHPEKSQDDGLQLLRNFAAL